MADENDLIDRCLRGLQDAYAELVDQHKALVFSIINRVVQDPTATEDLAQEVFLRVFRGLPRFRRQAKLSTWIYGITTRVCLEELRRPHQSRQHVSLDEDPAESAIDKDLASQSDPAFHRVDVSKDLNRWLGRLQPSASRCKSLHMTALRLIYLSPTFWRNYMAIREMGNNFRHDALVLEQA